MEKIGTDYFSQGHEEVGPLELAPSGAIAWAESGISGGRGVLGKALGDHEILDLRKRPGCAHRAIPVAHCSGQVALDGFFPLLAFANLLARATLDNHYFLAFSRCNCSSASIGSITDANTNAPTSNLHNLSCLNRLYRWNLKS